MFIIIFLTKNKLQGTMPKIDPTLKPNTALIDEAMSSSTKCVAKDGIKDHQAYASFWVHELHHKHSHPISAKIFFGVFFLVFFLFGKISSFSVGPNHLFSLTLLFRKSSFQNFLSGVKNINVVYCVEHYTISSLPAQTGAHDLHMASPLLHLQNHEGYIYEGYQIECTNSHIPIFHLKLLIHTHTKSTHSTLFRKNRKKS